MRPPRIDHRLTLRFRSNEYMDKVEQRANQDGLPIQDWIRQLIHHEMGYRRTRHYMIEEGLRALLTILYLFEKKFDVDTINRAKEKAAEKVKRLKFDQ